MCCIRVFSRYSAGEKTVFRVAGVNYSNCFVEVVQDSIGLWVGSVDLGSSGPDNHHGMRETVSDLENHPYCSALRDSGMAGVAAIKETIRVKSQVERSIKNALADIDSRQAFDFETTKLEKDSLVSNFGVELMWESRLNQAFFKILPSENWKSVKSRQLIVARSDWEQFSEAQWCEAWDVLESLLRVESSGRISGVFCTGSSFHRREFTDWPALDLGFESNQ